MALQDILEVLDKEAAADCERIVSNARLEAGALEADAREEAERIRSQKLEQAEAGVSAKVTQIVNAARLENKRAMSALREQGIESVFAESAKRLSTARADAGYRTLFKALADEALAGLEGDVVVQVDPRDEALAREILAGAPGLNLTIEPSLESSGGLIAVAQGGRIFRRNTLEDRLEKVRHIAQSQVAEILFA